jgi:hypothetical protein
MQALKENDHFQWMVATLVIIVGNYVLMAGTTHAAAHQIFAPFPVQCREVPVLTCLCFFHSEVLDLPDFKIVAFIQHWRSPFH